MVNLFLQRSSSGVVTLKPKVQSKIEGVFPVYTEEDFEEEFEKFFSIKKSEIIKGSKRTLYLMVKKGKV